MGEVKFGAAQIKNPTPSSLNLWVRVFTVVAGVFMGWMNTNTLIPSGTQDVINSILGLLLGICNACAPLFGVQVNARYVKKENVSAIDTPK